MKKLVLTLAITFIGFISCSSGEPKENDLQKENLKGKVKSITEIEYYPIEQGEKIIKGNTTSSGKIITFYNLKGNRIEKKQYNLGNDVILKFSYHYDNKELLTKWEVYDVDEELNKNKLIHQYTYKYDNDFLVETIWYNTNEDKSQKWVYKNNKKGQQIEEKICDIQGECSWTSTFEYDNKGNFIQKDSYKEEVLYERKIIKYDDNNNILEKKQYYIVDENLNTKYSYKYTKYDSNSNWIQQIEYENDKPQKIVEREIEYY